MANEEGVRREHTISASRGGRTSGILAVGCAIAGYLLGGVTGPDLYQRTLGPSLDFGDQTHNVRMIELPRDDLFRINNGPICGYESNTARTVIDWKVNVGSDYKVGAIPVFGDICPLNKE